MPDAIDQSWGRIDPHRAVAAGVKLVCGYLSRDPSKNWTPAWIRAYHAVGIGVLLNWESDPGRPLLGASAGHPDGADAVNQAQQLIRAVGYAPKNKIGIVFSCDRDTTPANYPAVDAYYAATKELTGMAGFLNGAYGEFDLIEHTHAAGLTEVEWQTLAWSGGRISTQADLYQSSINDHLGTVSVDFDQVLHPTSAGVWWPPGSLAESAASAGATEISTVAPIPVQEDDDMKPVFVRASTGRKSLWLVAPWGVNEVDPDPVQAGKSAAVLAAVLNILNRTSYSCPQGALEAGGNLINKWVHA